MRFVIESIDGGGNITWTEDIVYGTDATDKQDKADLGPSNSDTFIAKFSGTGMQSSVPSNVKLGDISLNTDKQAVSWMVDEVLNRDIGGDTRLVFVDRPGERVAAGTIISHYDTETETWTVGRVQQVSLRYNSQLTAWAVGNVYAQNDVMYIIDTTGGINRAVFFRAKDAHTANAGNMPSGQFAQGNAFWDVAGILESPAAFTNGDSPVRVADIVTIAVSGSDLDIDDVIGKMASSIKVSNMLNLTVGGPPASFPYTVASDGIVPLIGTVVFDTARRVIGRVVAPYGTLSGGAITISVETVSVLGHTWTSLALA